MNELEDVRKCMEALSVDLNDWTSRSDRMDELVYMIKQSLKDFPQLLPALDLSVLAAPSVAKFKEAQEMNEQLKNEVMRLNEQMALKEQELQGLKNQEVSVVDDDEAATVKCSLGSTRVVLSSLVDLPDDLEWDEFMTAWGVAVAISRGMREDQITAGADKWLTRFPGLCEQQADSSSAVQAAARLLARAFSDSPASLNRLHLLATTIKGLPAKELGLPLGLLFRFIAVRSTQLVVKEE